MRFAFAAMILMMLPAVPTAFGQDEPKEIKTYSANGRFLAHVIPVNPIELEERKTKKPELRVYAVEPGNKLRAYWKTELVNKYAPATVKITDDGLNVITFDDWRAIGRSDAVMAFYNSKGLLQKYSLEQLLGVRSIPEDSAVIPHTDESRLWRRHYLEVFEQSRNLPDGRSIPLEKPLYCLWLHHTAQWHCFDVRTGAQLPVDARLRAYLNEKLTPSLAADLQSFSNLDGRMPYNIKTSVMFLGTLKRDQDRKIFSQLMVNRDFNTAFTFAEIGGRELPVFYAESNVRRIADRVFAYWQGELTQDRLFSYAKDAPYFYLGTLKGSLKLPDVPTPDSGALYLYLIPAQADVTQWAASKPVHEMVIDFKRFPNAPLDTQVNYIIDGVLPGQYRVKAVWDKAEPFAPRDADVVAPGPGDFDNQLGRTTVTVKAKTMSTADAIEVDQKH